jgi:hypothetical protein
MNQLERFIEVYHLLDHNNLDRLAEIYAPEVRFSDPAHEIQGLDNLTRYFTALYAHISTIDFSFERQLQEADQAVLSWTMTFRHPRLAANREISVPGCSWLVFNSRGLALEHRDYFDLGAMLYEQLPLLGLIVRQVKGRLGQ